jgi:diacylglycerol kinase
MAHDLNESESATGDVTTSTTRAPHRRTLFEVPALDPQRLDELAAPTPWAPRPDRNGTRKKFTAGLRGLKHAIRGDSSFFAHAYRGTLIALTAALLSVDPLGWCLLVIAAGFVLVSELMHSAIDTLARAVGDPDDPPLMMAREIAAAAVVVASFISGALIVTVLLVKVGALFSWW